MIGIVITLLLASSMGVAIVLLARRRSAARAPVSGHLTPAERRQLYRRLRIDPALLVRQPRRYESNVIPFRPEARRRRSTEA